MLSDGANFSEEPVPGVPDDPVLLYLMFVMIYLQPLFQVSYIPLALAIPLWQFADRRND